MKKTIISIAAAALCASALSAQAFAENILTNKFLYANDQKLIAQSVKSWEHEGKKISPAPGTVIPLYKADLFDYAKTGNFEVEPDMLLDGNMTPTEGRNYISDAIDEDGNFVGTLEFIYGGIYAEISSFLPAAKNQGVESVVFDSDSKRINALMKKRSLNTSCNDIKLVFVNGLGYVYFIEDDDRKLLAATHLDDVNGNIFNDENGGLIVINDDFKAKADAELAAYKAYLEEWQKIVDSTAPGVPLPAGGYEPPMYKVDNTPYMDGAETPSTPNNSDNPNTGGTSSLLAGELGFALTACVIGVCAAKKKKDQ